MYILDELNAQNDYFSINLKCQLSLIAVNLIFFFFFFYFLYTHFLVLLLSSLNLFLYFLHTCLSPQLTVFYPSITSLGVSYSYKPYGICSPQRHRGAPAESPPHSKRSICASVGVCARDSVHERIRVYSTKLDVVLDRRTNM